MHGNPSDHPHVAWERLPWKKLEVAVYRLQKRIFQARKRGDTKTVHKIQKLLLKSKAARLLAVRRGTQDNQGKKTAGVAGVKSVPPAERLKMVEAIHPKQTEIATDFAPLRSCHDAIEAIHSSIKHKDKYVLDADIAGCCDNICHEALLSKLKTYPQMSRLIKGWLKAGVLDGFQFSPTEAGTPQGGVISPLVANRALHGLEGTIVMAYRDKDEPQVIRYADDFVVRHEVARVE